MFSIPFHVWMSDKHFNYMIKSLIEELKRIAKL